MPAWARQASMRAVLVLVILVIIVLVIIYNIYDNKVCLPGPGRPCIILSIRKLYYKIILL